jgi:hypothetical protein
MGKLSGRLCSGGVMAGFFAAVVGVLGVADLSRAAIFLTGDLNIANSLNGSGGAPGVDAGNQQFFRNVLGAGHSVLIHDDLDGSASGSGLAAPPAINNFFNSIAGVSSSLFSGIITPATLSGKNLFFELLPNDDFTAGELSAMNGFVAGGGSIFFMGENNFFFSSNTRINVALTSLASGMSILNTTFDNGFHTASGAQITPDPYTAGVTTFTYAAPSATAGGTVLVRGTGNTPFVTYVNVPEPSSALLTTIGVIVTTLTPLVSRRRHSGRFGRATGAGQPSPRARNTDISPMLH